MEDLGISKIADALGSKNDGHMRAERRAAHTADHGEGGDDAVVGAEDQVADMVRPRGPEAQRSG